MARSGKRILSLEGKLEEKFCLLEEDVQFLIRVEVIKGAHLSAMDVTGTSDPYCVIKFGRKEYKTTIIKKTLNPTWNTSFYIPVMETETKYPLMFEVWDWDRVSSNDLIGTVELDIGNIMEDEKIVVLDVERTEKQGLMRKNIKKVHGGQLHVALCRINRRFVESQFWHGLWTSMDLNGTGLLDRLEVCSILITINGSGQLESEFLNQICDECKDEKTGLISVRKLTQYFYGVDEENHKEVREKILPSHNFVYKVFLKLQENKDYTVSDVLLLHSLDFLDNTMQIQQNIDQILVFDRKTGKITVEKISNYITFSMKIMYAKQLGLTMTSTSSIQKLLEKMTVRQGRKYDSPESKQNIQPFIEYHQLNVSEIRDPLDSFQNFNEFFYRKLNPAARPVAEPDNPSVFVSPADCRFNCYESIDLATDIWIKGVGFTIGKLLNDEEKAGRFSGGHMAIARLAPQDYHRYHSPCDGEVMEILEIPGTYYTVNPIAVNRKIDVFCSNRRVIIMINSVQFGTIAYVAVGATMVGSIILTIKVGDKLKKGDEVGYFAFGGSTIVMLFEPFTIVFDKDLVLNSQKPLETRIIMGERIGDNYSQPHTPVRPTSPISPSISRAQSPPVKETQ